MYKFLLVVICCLTLSISVKSDNGQNPDKLLVVSIATDATEGYKRFIYSLKYFNIKHEIYGMNLEWKGGNMMDSLGGGQKINILKESLAKYKDDENLIIMFTDSYDVIFDAGEEEILQKFYAFNAKIVFSAEGTVWPDTSLLDQYPVIEEGKRFLCSGGIIGFAPIFWKTINQEVVLDNDDDQLYYTKIYLDAEKRTTLNATLDHTSELFQNINFAKEEVTTEVKGEITRVKNIKYNTYPVVIHGNGPSKLIPENIFGCVTDNKSIYLNYISNYVPDGWHPELGCRNCKTNMLDVDYNNNDQIPHVLLAVFIEQPTPFIEEFLERISRLSYPKSQITLFVHNKVQDHVKPVAKFLMNSRVLYKGSHMIQPSDNMDEYDARNAAVKHCLSLKCDYVFTVDSIVQITEPATMQILIAQNKEFIAPMMSRHAQLWSNFWGALNLDGFYARSEDYLDIVNKIKVGIWNVPFVSSIYMVKASMLNTLLKKVPEPFVAGELDADMAFCHNLRHEYIFMHITNEKMFGHLVNADSVKQNVPHPDLWQVEKNKVDWEEKYLHSEFYSQIEEGTKVAEPCPDAFTFPLMTDKMADDLIDIMEYFNLWSNGKNEDPRLAGGYENVPTVDTHMNQVGYEKEWLYILRTYAAKIIEKVYPGYYTQAKSSMMFIVRYKPTEQPFLRPHHDSSTWTMNVALNTHGVDYQGGGCRFLRYNCTIVGLPKGHAVVHPGRLTHFHEGLYTTEGTRYIFVSFVDP